jgi:hypothetical protein
MKETKEILDGEIVDAIFTQGDVDAMELLMTRAGMFLNALDHCSRFHHGVVTAAFLYDLLDDISHIQQVHDLPEPRPDWQ